MLHHARVGLGAPTDALATYGQSAAAKVITAVSGFPPNQRAAQIQKLLDGIDRTLWPAVNKLLKKGVPWQPALASVFSSHVLAFFTRVGAGQSLQGLGALPAINTGILSTVTTVDTTALTPTTPDGACSPDGQFVWRNSPSGHWERRAAGDTTPCTIVADVGPSVGTGAQGGRTVTPTNPPFKVGPFTFNLHRDGSPVTWSYDSYDQLTPDQAKLLHDALAAPPSDGAYWRTANVNMLGPGNWMGGSEPGMQSILVGPNARYDINGNVASFQGNATWQWPATPTWMTWAGWLRTLGFKPTDNYNTRRVTSGQPWTANNNDPIVAFTMPANAGQVLGATTVFPQQWGLYAWWEPVGSIISSSNGSAAGVPPLKPLQQSSWRLNITAMPLLPGASWFTQLAGGFYGGVVDVAGTLSDIVCGLAANPGVVAAGATAVGGPAAGGAAAAGATIMQSQCNQGKQPVPQVAPPVPPPSKTPWGYIIAGGLAILGVGAYVLTQPPPRRAA